MKRSVRIPAVVALSASCLLLEGTLISSEEQAQAQPRPIEIKLSYAPRPAKAGEEITITAAARNTTDRLVLANLRLMLPEEVRLILPDAEQTVFVEAGASREVKWKATIVREAAWRMYVEPTVVSQGRPMNGMQVKVPEPAAAALSKPWAGRWTSPTSTYDALLKVRVDASGAVEGRLEWTLVKAPEGRKDYVGKEGAQGVEFVWGAYDPVARNLDMEGYRRDDPQEILGLDRYRLTLSEDLTEIKGFTWNHGTWKALFRLTPKE